MKARSVLVLLFMICIVMVTFAIFMRELKVLESNPVTVPIGHTTTNDDWHTFSMPSAQASETPASLSNVLPTSDPFPTLVGTRPHVIPTTATDPGCIGNCGDGI